MKTKITLLLLLSVLISCTDKAALDQPIIHSIDIVKELDKADSLSLTNEFEVKKIIALKNPEELPIVEITKLFIHDGNIFTFDQTSSTLLAFDSTGTYQYSIGKIGEGEGEFIDLSDVALDKEKNVLFLFSNSSRALYTFTPEGAFLKKYKIPFYASSIALLPDSNLAFYINYNTSEANAMHNVLITDQSGNIKEKYMPYTSESTPSLDISGYVGENQAGALASTAFSDTIYQLSNAGISPKYVLKLGKFQYKNFEKKDVMAIMQDLPSHYFLKSRFVETANWLTFTIGHKGKESKFFYNPSINYSISDVQFNKYSSIHYLKQPLAIINNMFVSQFFSDYFIYMKEDREKILSQVKKEDSKLFELFSNSKDTNHPTLVFFSKKEK
ncbi:6-bladed beta-propeller [Arundinibacter roseus]|uniref:6-bladed beta-propeller n=1 Tax=Arundinibacter roseus TaxID=2070510 RepID=A0A4V2XA08_9BACT|nr:6-bladed beta-propeller [Arundinibacter roseus]TDB65815.1 6-bladed beta-propeller [Arundinibacter roseus]